MQIRITEGELGLYGGTLAFTNGSLSGSHTVKIGLRRGEKDLAKFAKRLTQAQRRALGIRRNPQRKYPAPSQTTFSRFFQGGDGVQGCIKLAFWRRRSGVSPEENAPGPRPGGWKPPDTAGRMPAATSLMQPCQLPNCRVLRLTEPVEARYG